MLNLRIKRIHLYKCILIVFLSFISFKGLRLYMQTIGHNRYNYGKLKTYKYENLTNYLKKLPLSTATDRVVNRNLFRKYDKLLIGLDQVGDLDTLSNEQYKVVKKQLQDEAQMIVDHEPKFFNRIEKNVDRLELLFFMQYARDVQSGKRGEELEPEWEWARDISIVYTWINGTDDKLLEEKAKLNGGIKKADQRDRCVDELRYSLRSLCKNLPWHKGKIFFITPNQTPHWLDTSNPRIKVISQYDILPKKDYRGKDVYPTFNSFAIEWFLDRVPGVTEQFIQLNDEYFFRKPVHPSFFFFGGGEGYANSKIVKKERDKENANESNNGNKEEKKNRFYKRNNEDESKENGDDIYVHGVKIDKDIVKLVDEKLKEEYVKDHRKLFLQKRRPEDEGEAGEVGVEDFKDDNNPHIDIGKEENIEDNADMGDIDIDDDNDGNDDNENDNKEEVVEELDNEAKERADKREKFLQYMKEREKEEEFDNKMDPGEQPDNEDEGIGIIPKKKFNEKLYLKTEDLVINPDNTTTIVRRDRILAKRPPIHRYIYPNAAQHYRFVNVYLTQQYLVSGFGKAREVGKKNFKKTPWIEKFFGSMAMTNACISEDQDHSTLINMLEHAPYVWNRDLFEMARRKFKNYLDFTVSHKFRHPQDFVPPYANNYFLRFYASKPGFEEEEFDKFYNSKYIHDVNENDDATQKTRSILKYGFHIVDHYVRIRIINFGSIRDNTQRNARTFKGLIENETLLFFNLNDDYSEPEAGEQLKQFMKFLYPEPSIFEKEGY